MTAVCRSIASAPGSETSMCRISSVPSNFGGAAMLAVTISAATMASSRIGLRIDPSRRAAEQQHERGVHGDEKESESDLPDDRRLAQRAGRTANEAVPIRNLDQRRLQDTQRRHT